MKLKCEPADFRVQEITALPTNGGPFSVYELGKRSLGTLEAIHAIAERWRLPRQTIAFAGLKDKHAETRQTITIFRGPKRGLKQQHFQLNYLGQANRAVESSDIQCNRFEIAVRDLSAAEVATANEREPAVQSGIPNYFDDQRFGSLGESGEFIARPWCLGDWERTLWLMLADANEHDPPVVQEQKRLLRVHWRSWDTCLAGCNRAEAGATLRYLARHPTDFRGAIATVRPDLRSLYLAAYQSDLWNGILSEMIADTVPASMQQRMSLGRRELVAWDQPGPAIAQLQDQTLPLPSARLHEISEPARVWIERVLHMEGLQLRQLRVKYPRDSFFSKGERPVFVQPTDYSAVVDSDERYRGKQRLTLSFTLPRGAYATVLVKRLFASQ